MADFSNMNRRKFINRSVLALAGTTLFGCFDRNRFKFEKNQVVGCFGDSITFAQGNGYVEMLQEKFNEERPELNLKFINLGKNSETVTGLTEKDHPGPRPYLFERLDQALDNNDIDVALFCYGMNDGIYGKPSKTLFNSFKIGVYSFLEKMRQRDIKTILITPPPLALAIAPRKDPEATSFGYKNPYPKYDEEVLKEFTRIILEMQHPYANARINIRDVLYGQDPCYDKDPIHPNKAGQRLIADTIFSKLAF
ncbi:GDSL-type esterase/lipase family protein [Zobellia galactanivorans]|uniref:SGNH/GDSL hydrolase family protein n=1 Tax=Zobellia galactanivorans (strain DSM 12802 / CCUG 47099 / CIP 106680 / NCIMB 13871 / Dsij) TaxID=63186 RepID=UPI0026E35FA1|nr:GDSL-type esterase/lipase family protein [Zobellia galactanivorans]MDO6808465.1 GDSL-type esterase/lipase family protein [Zobellia galactanivorans]